MINYFYYTENFRKSRARKNIRDNIIFTFANFTFLPSLKNREEAERAVICIIIDNRGVEGESTTAPTKFLSKQNLLYARQRRRIRCEH